LSDKNKVNSYGWASPGQPHTAAYITPKILEILEELNVTRVVDLGAGNGVLCGKMQQAGYDVVGVEYDSKGASLASENYPGVPIYNLDITDTSPRLLDHEAMFDAAVSTEVVEHLFSPHQFVAYANAVIKPGGHLIISTPYHGYLKNLALSLAGKWDDHHTALWHGGYIKFWSRKTLSKLLEENGFSVVKFYGVGRIRFLWKSMIMVAVKPIAAFETEG